MNPRRRSIQICSIHCSRTSDHPGRGVSSETKVVADFQIRAQGNQFIDDATASAEYGLPVAEHVPRKADTWREVITVGVVESRDLGANLDQPHSRVKSREDGVFVLHNSAGVVAQTEVQCQPRTEAPIILQIETPRIPSEVVGQIAVLK